MPRRTPKSKRSGAAAVEFALIAPMFVTLLLGMVESGNALHTSATLLSAARSGARFAAMDWTDKLAAGETPNQKVIRDVRNFLLAAGIPGDKATISLTHAEGESEDSEFDLADETNDLKLFRIKVSIPFSEVSTLPSNYFNSNVMSESVVARAGRATLSN